MDFGAGLHRLLVGAALLERRIDRHFRGRFDAAFQEPLAALVQVFIRRTRARHPIDVGEEVMVPGEDRITADLIEQMSLFTRTRYAPGEAQRVGNTKTYGIVRAEFDVLADIQGHLRKGVFREPRTYLAWVRFSGPGPSSPPDIEDAGILSIGIKLMGVEGPKLLDDEKFTQDFTGISAPTFTTPDIVENLKLQRQLVKGTPLFYFINPLDSHYLDMLMQGLYARVQPSPLEVRYYSCTPYLLGERQVIKYSIKPRSSARSKIPGRPSDNYLREAMALTLAQKEIEFDFMVQVQTDPRQMPVEDASIRWSERLSPFVPVARLRLPVQKFDSPAQLAFADALSLNPWHSLAEHRPLGNQNRARRTLYYALSRLRQAMNAAAHVEPTGEEKFD